MNSADLGAIKRLADRLQVRDSDVVRYAVKTVLARLAPLFDEALRGRSLVPVLMESCDELIRHFDLDVSRLDAVVNGDELDASRRVDREDLRIIAMHGMNPALAMALNPRAPAAITSRDPERRPETGAAAFRSELHRYMYEKYVACAAPRAEE